MCLHVRVDVFTFILLPSFSGNILVFELVPLNKEIVILKVNYAVSFIIISIYKHDLSGFVSLLDFKCCKDSYVITVDAGCVPASDTL